MENHVRQCNSSFKPHTESPHSQPSHGGYTMLVTGQDSYRCFYTAFHCGVVITARNPEVAPMSTQGETKCVFAVGRRTLW